MNNKDKFLYSLHQARLEHTKWVSKMRILASGVIDSDIETPKSFFDTNFSKWFQEKATYLLFEEKCNSLKEIEILMQHLDSEYMLLYNICVKNRSKTFLGKIKPLGKKDEGYAQKYLHSIQFMTKKLEDLLQELNKGIINVRENSFYFMEMQEDEKSDKNSKSKKYHSGARGAYQD